jgi:carbonic anhydrase
MQLLEKLAALGVNRQRLPENLQEFFGMFGSERQNVIKAAEFVRRSPIIGEKVPVHGLLIDLQTGRLESIVNGYDTFNSSSSTLASTLNTAGKMMSALEEIGRASVGEMQFPKTRIGEGLASANEAVRGAAEIAASLKQRAPQPVPPPIVAEPPRLPRQKPARFNIDFRQFGKPR